MPHSWQESFIGIARKSLKLNKICQLCTKTEHQCICLQSTLKIYKAVGQWLDTRKKETIYDKYLFSYFLNYKYIKSSIQISDDNHLDSLVNASGNAPVSDDNLLSKLSEHLPEVEEKDEHYTIKSWNISLVAWSEIIFCLQEFFCMSTFFVSSTIRWSLNDNHWVVTM